METCSGSSKLTRPWDWRLQLFAINVEFLVRAIHYIVLITSLPFVHTARRFNRLDELANFMGISLEVEIM